jgi:hypothetical protein
MNCRPISSAVKILASLCACAFGILPAAAIAAGNCSFKPQPPVTLTNMGLCQFDPEKLSFAGSAAQQAKCLLNPVQPVGRLGPPLKELPAALAERVGLATDLPDRERMGAWLAERGLSDPLGDSLVHKIAFARDGDPQSRPATYFVIHDTSSPNYGNSSWPRNLDEDAKLNNLNRYVCANDIERAHVFINRGGAILLAHDFSVPWRATKFERRTPTTRIRCSGRRRPRTSSSSNCTTAKRPPGFSTPPTGSACPSTAARISTRRSTSHATARRWTRWGSSG